MLDALDKLRKFGWTPEHDQMHNAHYALGNAAILSAMYPTGYGRFSVTDNVCNTQLRAGRRRGRAGPRARDAEGAELRARQRHRQRHAREPVYNDSVGGPRVWNIATSVSTGVQDFGLDNALCQRALVTGVDETGAALTATASSTRPTAAQSAAVRAGIAEVLLTESCRASRPSSSPAAATRSSRSNNNSRAYVAYNKVQDGSGSRTSYIEVTNAQHFDTFIPFSGFDNRFVPLHAYFVRAMDAMYAHLRTGRRCRRARSSGRRRAAARRALRRRSPRPTCRRSAPRRRRSTRSACRALH